MIVNSSTVGMAAMSTKSMTYREKNTDLMFNIGAGERTTVSNSISRDSADNMIVQLRQYLFNFRNRLSMMIGRRYNGMMSGMYGMGYQTWNMSSGMQGVSVWRRIESRQYTYKESESMTFQTVGKVVTADGRTIDFNMQLEMSREYTESIEHMEETTVIMTDPLVINLKDSPISVSDEKWKFDIDGDGKEDSISRLSEGAGYLVLDKNKDGIINDGSEMFGAKTGNGFSELRAYDDDGNGWIDENDKIYKDLAVWVKDDAGHDKLISLKEANVGAMYLGSVSSEYSMKSEKDNEYNAEIRRSGMYLTEDGRARSVQQLDMVNALIS